MTGSAIRLVHVRCRLCGADDAEPIRVGRDRWHGLPGRFVVVRCRRCGLAYQDPQPAPESLAACYPADYQAYRHRDGGRRRDERLDRRLKRAVVEAVLRRSMGYPGRGPAWAALIGPLVRRGRHSDRLIAFRPPGRLLDVGCGSGAFLVRMRGLGWQVGGVEPDESAARYARDALGLEVLTGDVSHPDLPEGGFDAVTFWHTLEHVADPLGALRRARRLVRPGGIVVIQAPNGGGVCARLFGADWLGLDLPRHLTHFTDRTMRRAVRAAGLRVVGLRHERLPDGWKWSVRRRWPRARWLQRRKWLWRAAADLAALLGAADVVTVTAERPRNATDKDQA